MNLQAQAMRLAFLLLSVSAFPVLPSLDEGLLLEKETPGCWHDTCNATVKRTAAGPCASLHGCVEAWGLEDCHTELCKIAALPVEPLQGKSVAQA